MIKIILGSIAILLATMMALGFLFLCLQLFCLLFFDTTIGNLYRHLRHGRFAPKDGVIDEVPVTAEELVNYDGVLIRESFKNVLKFDMPWCRIDTVHKGLLVRFYVPRDKIQPYVTIVKDNPNKHFMLRIRFDPMTFMVHEVLGLAPKTNKKG